MINKNLKFLLLIVLAVIVVLTLNFNKCFAAIDMNLTGNTSSLNSANVTNTINKNNTIDENVLDDDDDNTTAATTSNQATTSTNNTVATVSSLSSLPESELGLTNILNILLIAVGFVLILLGIAIIIKLKK